MGRRAWIIIAATALAPAFAVGVPAAASRGASDLGDARRGRVIVARQACGSCHEIPGIGQADGRVGPPLAHFARRAVIAGVLPNRAGDLVRWLRLPQQVVRGNAMPDVGLSEAQARDVAAFLYTLR